MGINDILKKIQSVKEAFGQTVSDTKDNVSYLKEGINNIQKEDKDEQRRGIVELACAVSSDYYTLKLAKYVYFPINGVFNHGHKHLDHYLAGTGASMRVDLGRVLREDSKVKSKVYQVVRDNLWEGKGSIGVTQFDYSNTDWHFAIGGMYISWRVVESAKIKLWFENKYQWHPEEHRVSQCVHEAAIALQKKMNAKDYMMYGETEIYIRDL
jgi:hypothetical protein